MGSTDQACTDLVVDIGNSRVKLALFRGGELLRSVRMDELTAPGLDGFLSGDRPGAIGVASVGAPAKWPLHVLSGLAPVYELTGASPSPVPNAYANPRTLGVDRLACIVSVDKLVYAVDASGERYLLDMPLAELEAALDPARFFRASRQVLLAADAVLRFAPVGKGRIRVELRPDGTSAVIVSQERAAAFKAWLAV